jgi:Ca2+-binding EF-hand superfamily protein
MQSLQAIKEAFHKWEVVDDAQEGAGSNAATSENGDAAANGNGHSESQNGNSASTPERQSEQKGKKGKKNKKNQSQDAGAASPAPSQSEKSPSPAAAHSKQPGYIPRCFLAQALMELDINPIFTDLEAMIDQYDPQGEGKIGIEEFKSFYLTLYREYSSNPQKALTTFMHLDLDRDGFLSKQDMYAHTCADHRVDKLTDEEFEDFWEHLGAFRTEGGELCAAAFVVSMCPDVQPDELNPLLLAYGLEPNAALYCKIKPKPKATRKPLTRKQIEDRKKKRQESEEMKKKQAQEAELRRQQEEERAAEEARAEEKRKEDERRQQEEKAERERREERERRRKEEEEQERKRKAEADEKKKREDEQKRKDEEAKKKEAEGKKEEKGGCCAVS